MTKTSPLTRTVTFHARAGEAPALAEKLSEAAALVEELEILAFGSHVPGDGEMVAGLPDHA